MSSDGSLYHYHGDKNIIEGLDLDDQKLKISSFIRKNLISDNLNFLVGSGCSFGAIPSMGTTFNEIKQDLDQDALGKYKCEENGDIESYLNWLNTAIIFLNETNIEENIDPYYENFKKTKQALVDSININYEEKLDTLNLYTDFFNEIFAVRENKDFSPLNIFTTNYDLFNEIAMEKSNIRYTNGFRGTIYRTFDPSDFHLRLVDDLNRYKEKWSIVRKFVKLYKIHGSINWFYDSKINKVTQGTVNDSQVENVLIYPTINKHIETQQTPYSELFREFTINLQKSNSTLIVLGYGFPDQHINQLMSQALSNEDFTLIIFGSLEEEKVKSFFDQHKRLRNVHFIGGRYAFDSQKADGHHFKNIVSYLKGDDINE
ncbi:SIR2 family protein [Piscibacillus halophilus]|uniref:SIR2-like domain-containing protein n=1 Tax=Piscibacillus halophilus TaxID=571933 RepID=A0A1H9KPS7_9BACI|nr:SIR2 family protein [Piscibacillus halophilus]SER01112.1 SIR2-like domain-containing protein [Piscibacillus halophilus]